MRVDRVSGIRLTYLKYVRILDEVKTLCIVKWPPEQSVNGEFKCTLNELRSARVPETHSQSNLNVISTELEWAEKNANDFLIKTHPAWSRSTIAVTLIGIFRNAPQYRDCRLKSEFRSASFIWIR